MEKVKKISILVLILLLTLSMYVNAIETVVIKPNQVIMGMYYGPRSSNPSQDRWILTSYSFDNNNKQYTLSVGGSTYTEPFVAGFLTSYIKPDTFYKITFVVDITDQQNESLFTETGIIKATNSEWFNLIQKETFVDLPQNLNGRKEEIITTYQNSLMNDDYYTMFYDKTSNEFSVLFYIPNQYWESHPELHQQVYLVSSLGATQETNVNLTFKIDEYTGLSARDNYTDILAEISQKLENIAASGGGITEEQVNQAVQDALAAHDQQLEQQVNGKLEQIMEQINGIVTPYKDAAEQINTAFDGLSDVFASTSTASAFKFPAGRLPNGRELWPEYNIDISAAWFAIPQKFRAVVQIVCTFTILYSVVQEAIYVIKFIVLGRKGTEDD